jgi:hypothetical protein
MTMVRFVAFHQDSGNYYLKSDADGNNKFYTTGMIKLDKGVTNVVTIELQ